MKRRPKPSLTPRQVSFAIAAQSLRTARVWLVRFPDGTERQCRYQTPATMLQVLAEHSAAIAAEPADEPTASTSTTNRPGRFAGNH